METDIRSDVAGDVIPLSRAVLCANCSNVTEPRQGRCRACGSDSILGLAKILDREDHVSPSYRRQEFVLEVLGALRAQPVGKCATCGELIFTDFTTHYHERHWYGDRR